jgi:COP9 signalosome complex subunit 6
MSSSAPVALHPLVIVNISDHYTRHKLNATDAQAVGVLMGRQDGNKISLLDSVEVRVETVGAERALDRNHMNTRMSLFKAVYPNTEMMGWYLVGARHAEHDKGLHKQFQEFNESPLLLVLDPSENRMLVESEKKELPVSLFELRLQVVNERSETSFVPLPFRIETLDPERVTVDHIARGTVHRGAGSALTPHLSTLYNAVAMLKERVVLLRCAVAA